MSNRIIDKSFSASAILKEFLCTLQVDISCFDFRKTALHIAVRNTFLSMVELLMSYGADPFVKNGAGMSPVDMCVAPQKGSKIKTWARKRMAEMMNAPQPANDLQPVLPMLPMPALGSSARSSSSDGESLGSDCGSDGDGIWVRA